jgi:hypothetical protein
MNSYVETESYYVLLEAPWRHVSDDSLMKYVLCMCLAETTHYSPEFIEREASLCASTDLTMRKHSNDSERTRSPIQA